MRLQTVLMLFLGPAHSKVWYMALVSARPTCHQSFLQTCLAQDEGVVVLASIP